MVIRNVLGPPMQLRKKPTRAALKKGCVDIPVGFVILFSIDLSFPEQYLPVK
jgi:hypothetical protein